MKRYPFASVVLTLLCGCELVESDPCEETAILNGANVQLAYNYFLYEPDGSLTEREVKVQFEKIACGQEDSTPGSRIEYSGYMGPDGFFRTGTANYDLRNEEDQILISFWSISDVGLGLHDYEYLTVNDFVGEPIQLRDKTIELGVGSP